MATYASRLLGDAPDQIALKDVPKFLPGRPSVNCLWRWINWGLADPQDSGRKIKLRSHKIGGRIFIARDDLEQFLTRLNPDAPSVESADSGAGTQAGRALAALGC